ncbi:MAG: IS66 family transposase, partial [Deltaproteobacteria bacterium]|nr:IS66 family transposase [Deltaproteobacteria bacterium]
RLKNQHLKEKLKVFQKRFIGRKSEKLTEEEKLQLHLFNEAESIIDKEESEQAEDAEKVAVKGHTRKKKGRKPLPDDLPREEKIHDLPDEEKKCPCCGEMRPCIGSDSTEELDFIPAQIKVIKHTRLKYGPCKCEDFRNEVIPEVKSAPGPVRLIRNSIVSPGLLSYVLVSKYVDALPFNRQSKMFSRIDVEISKATMCNWAMLAAEKCKGLFDLMWEEAKSGHLIQMDETTLQVLKEPGRDPTRKSQMWVALGYPEYGRPIVLYNYRTSKSKDIPVELLNGYEGYLQTDGYAGYNKVGSDEDIIHVGCFAHARRYFHDAFKLSKKSNTGKRGLSFIKELYKIERETREKYFAPDEFTEARKEKAEPVLSEFYKWLQIKVDTVAPASKAGEAIEYTLNEWDKLIRYIGHYYLTPDNNAVERAIRPFVIGRNYAELNIM